MHKSISLLLVLFSLASCIKEEEQPEPIIEPVPLLVVSRDTITTGEKWGLKIGDTPAQLYSKIQAFDNVENKVSYLSVVGNRFTDLDSIMNKIPLYSSILLDETVGTSKGIQIYFSDDKVKSIWSNDGISLNKWPLTTSGNATIAIADRTEKIYDKLINIKKIDAYKSKLERISLFEKNIKKGYDENMGTSKLWYFTTPVNENRFNEVHLNFTEGKLVSIYFIINEVQK